MNIRNLFNVARDEAGGDGDTGGGAGGAAGTQNNTNNNNKDNVTDYTDLWNTDNKGAATPAPASAPAPAAPTSTPAEDLQNHINGLNLTAGVDVNKVMADMQSGNGESFQAALDSISANGYKAAMGDAQKMMQAQVAEAVDKAVSQANGNHRSDTLIRDMNTALPFTESPEIAPLAKAVLTQFVKSGKSHKDAIAETGKFFEHVSTKVPGSASAPAGKPGAGNFNASTSNNADDTNWEEILGGLTDS